VPTCLRALTGKTIFEQEDAQNLARVGGSDFDRDHCYGLVCF
jgi:hypothetical protein